MRYLLALSLLLSACGYKEAQLREQREVQKLVEANQSEIEACYDKALSRNPNLPSGQMTVRADQNHDGSLHSTRLIRGFAGSNDVFDCVARKVNSWKTPPPKTWGPVEVSFDFRNRGMAAKAAERDFGSIVAKNRERLNQCFGSTSGKVAVKFLRTKEGRVENLEMASGSPGTDRVFECLAMNIKQWRLAEVNDDSQMVWTFQSKANEN